MNKLIAVIALTSTLVGSLYANECSIHGSPAVPVYSGECSIHQAPVVPVYSGECSLHQAPVVPVYANECAVQGRVAPTYIAAPSAPLYVNDCYAQNPCVMNVNVNDSEGLYASIIGGVNFLQVHKDSKKKTGYMGGIALGYRLNHSVRLEAEVAYRRNKVKTLSEDTSVHNVHVAYETYSAIANLYYDFDTGSNLIPYLGAGVGYVNNRTDLHKKGKDYSQKQGFVYQGMAGIDYRISKKTYVSLEYRYLTPKKHFHDHAGLMSVKRYF